MDLTEFLNKEQFSSFVNGDFVSSKNEDTNNFISPVTKKAWKSFSLASEQQVQTAIEAAQNAFFQWKITPSPVRGMFLRQCGDALLANKELLADVMAMEMGKTIRDGIKEVEYSAGFFHWFAGEAERIYGLTIPSQHIEKRIMVLKEPIGVSGLITPWNFPLAMPARKIGAALAAGCTAILKPASECPLSGLAIAYIFQSLGLPPGVLNVVIGDEKKIGKALLESPIVRKIGFTGSDEVGKYLYAQSAPTLKKLTLELGGHAPFIVFDDANLERVIEGIMISKFRNSGQTCIAPNRMIVQEKIFPEFLKELIKSLKEIKTGNPLNPSTDLTNILHSSASKKVKKHVDDAVKKGAKIEYEGKEMCDPFVLSGVTENMLIFNEETFGPVVPITTFKTMPEAIMLANRSQYGLASYLFTENLTTAHIIIGALEYGIIGLNDGLPSSPQLPFGGMKYSGFGKEGGPSGMDEYLVEKSVSIRI